MPTFLWGVILTVVGGALAAVGFGWWDISSIDLRYVGPSFLILIGIVMLLGAVSPAKNRSSRSDSAG
jgi:small neutral amino acid transporter SnatA (MarC family)